MSSQPFYQEHRDRNAGRAFPFSELLGGPVSELGHRLPADVVVDAAVLCLATGATCELRSIDFSARTLTGVAGGVAFEGAWGVGDTTVRLTEADAYARPAGCLVLGDRAASMSGRWDFPEGAAVFEPAAMVAGPAECVRGFVLPGADLCHGPVVFVSGLGVRAISYIDGATGQHRLRVDAVGAVAEPDACSTCGPVRCLRIEADGQSLVAASGLGRGVAVLDTPTLSMLQLCAGLTKRRKARPDPCDPAPGCPDGITRPPDSAVLVCPSGGHITLITPSTPGHVNPMNVRVVDGQPAPIDTSTVGLTGDIRSMERRVAHLQNRAETAPQAVDIRLASYTPSAGAGA